MSNDYTLAGKYDSIANKLVDLCDEMDALADLPAGEAAFYAAKAAAMMDEAHTILRVSVVPRLKSPTLTMEEACQATMRSQYPGHLSNRPYPQ